MMGFQDPFQQEHKKMGMLKAAKSKRTPAHLRPHLMRAAQQAMNSAVKPTQPMRPAMGANAMRAPVKAKPRKFPTDQNPIYG